MSSTSTDYDVKVILPEAEILLSLGGNLPSAHGGPAETQKAALGLLAQAGVALVAVSGLYRTSPVPASDQPDFINIAVKAQTRLAPAALMALCHRVEQALGRLRAERWSARTLDIDLLAYGDEILPTRADWQAVASHADPAHFLGTVTVPHPRLHHRGFVLKPLYDVAPDWRHPVLGQTVAEMLAAEMARGGLRGIHRISDRYGRFPALQGQGGTV